MVFAGEMVEKIKAEKEEQAQEYEQRIYDADVNNEKLIEQLQKQVLLYHDFATKTSGGADVGGAFQAKCPPTGAR